MRNEIYGVFVFLIAIWLVYIVDAIIPADLVGWGLEPRTLRGLIGILLAPLLHNGFGHLLGNSIPLFILLVLLAVSRSNQWLVVASITLLTGVMLWLFGRAAIHVGASGLVFGLITYLIVVGFREKQFVSLGIAIAVGFLFGGTLFFGVLPRIGSSVSWEGHLFGAIAGGMVAVVSTRRNELLR